MPAIVEELADRCAHSLSRYGPFSLNQNVFSRVEEVRV